MQIATEGQYTLAYDVFPNPSDTRTFIPFLDKIEKDFFELPNYIVADAGYCSERKYEDVLTNRQRIPLITYNSYRQEKKKKFKDSAFHSSNWQYDEESDAFICQNDKNLTFQYVSHRTDQNGFKRTFKVYECEDCCTCPFRSQCTKAEEGNNRRIYYNEKWEQQKEYIRQQLSEEVAGKIQVHKNLRGNRLSCCHREFTSRNSFFTSK